MTITRQRPRLLSVAFVMGLAAVVVGSVPAMAGRPYSVGPHSGNYGVHILIDNEEYAGARCDYGTDHIIKEIRIRRPIVFGFDRTGGIDSQWVGWRYRIEYQDEPTTAGAPYSDWPDLYVSGIFKARASDKHNAHFEPQVYTFAGDASVHKFYRVSIQLIWYYPGSSTKDGRAVHVAYHYGTKDPVYGLGESTESCYYSYEITAASGGGPTLGPHSGNYGTHTLIHTEYPGATCVYGSNEIIKKVRIRSPIVFGFDRTGGIDTQWVGWRYRIEYQDDPTTTGVPYEDWPDLYVSDIFKVQTSDQHVAHFQPRMYTFAGDPPTHTFYRVSIQMFWYYPGSTTQDGNAVHLPATYAWTHPSYGPGLYALRCHFMSTED